MKSRTRVVIFSVFAVALFAWACVFFTLRTTSCVIFPEKTFGIYTLTDAALGGTSTSEIEETDSSITASINVRSGVAYPAVGVGFNLMSIDNRPTGVFDLSYYDSIEVVASTGRMRSISLRILTDDPVYTKEGFRETLRPLVLNVPASRSLESAKFSLTEFKTAVWWLAAMGMEKDDGFTYLHRSTALEIANGDGIMRGIPDEINVKMIRLWGVNRDFERGMYAGLILMIVMLGLFGTNLFRIFSRKNLKTERKNV